MENLDLDELRFTNIYNKKILRKEEKFPAVGTTQGVSFGFLLFSTWLHDTTMLLNSPPWTADNAIYTRRNFREKKSYGRAVKIRPVIEYSREPNRGCRFRPKFRQSRHQKNAMSLIVTHLKRKKKSLKSVARAYIKI